MISTVTTFSNILEVDGHVVGIYWRMIIGIQEARESMLYKIWLLDFKNMFSQYPNLFDVFKIIKYFAY